jgi:hypothetical protein
MSNGLATLHMKAFLSSIGYLPFQPDATYLHSSISWIQASFQNKESDPLIYEIGSIEGKTVKVWNDFLYNVIQSMSWNDALLNDSLLDEEITFKSDLYINEDRFIIRVSSDDFTRFLNFKDKNIFQRPVIRGIDNRLDLGNLLFIITDIGLLFSAYEHPRHKTIDDDLNMINIYANINEFIKNKNINFNIQEQQIGAYGYPFMIKTIHVLPKGNQFYSQTYENFQ